MAEFDSKVVSFERNATYLHDRALKNKKSGRGIDALELMRRAVDREPDNTRFQLDLAIQLSEMGLFEQASMTIEKVLLSERTPEECLYAMGVIQFNKGDVSKAERLLRAYVDSEKTAREAEAKRLLDEITIAREALRPDRKTLRAMRCVDRACRMMMAYSHAEADKMFLLAMRMNDSAPEVHALRGMNFQKWGRKAEALEEIQNALDCAEKYDSGKVRVYAISAQIYAQMGNEKMAEAAIDEALKEDVQGNDLRMLLSAMYDVGCHEKIYELVPKALNDAPYDKSLLHALSVSAYYMGLDTEEALTGWRRIERLDPVDPVCKYFIKYVREDENADISYAYRLPADEAMRRANVLMNCLFMGDERVTEIYGNDEEFRSIVDWEIYQPDSRFTRLALSCMMAAKTKEAEKRIRVFVDRPDLPMNVRNFVMTGRAMLGRPLKMELPDKYVHAGMPTEEELMSELSVGEKQMIRYAAEYVEDQYRDYPVADIAMIWTAFVEKRGRLGVNMVSTEAGSAALAMCYLNMTGKMDDIFTVSRWYGCSSRQAAFVARLIKNCIDQVPER